MPRRARQGSQLFGCQKAASSGGLGRSLEHLDPAEEHLTLGGAAGQEAASLSLCGCASCGGDKAAKLFIKPFEMAGGCRPGQQLGVGVGGIAVLSGPALVVTWPLAPRCSSLAIQISIPTMQLPEKGASLLPIHSPTSGGRTCCWRMETGREGLCIPGQGVRGRKGWSFKGLALSAPLCGYEAAPISLLAQERPLKEDRKSRRMSTRTPLCLPTLSCPVPAIALGT